MEQFLSGGRQAPRPVIGRKSGQRPDPVTSFNNSTEPFAACYWDTAQGRVFSLRSTDEGADVAAIAKQYGGGGHRSASGFKVPLSEIGQFEIA